MLLQLFWHILSKKALSPYLRNPSRGVVIFNTIEIADASTMAIRLTIQVSCRISLVQVYHLTYPLLTMVPQVGSCYQLNFASYWFFMYLYIFSIVCCSFGSELPSHVRSIDRNPISREEIPKLSISASDHHLNLPLSPIVHSG